MKININIGGKILVASLADNATARDFVSLLPLHLSMKDLFGREKYGDLPKKLSENGPRKNRYQVGDIAYWFSESPVCCLLPPGWRVHPFAGHYSYREGGRWYGGIQRIRLGQGDH